VRLDSDIDIGVLYRSPQPLRTTVAVEAALAEATGKRVNVVDVARAGAFLALDAGDLLPVERQRQALMLGSSR
jgi:predicted nucleotidyltransferase